MRALIVVLAIAMLGSSAAATAPNTLTVTLTPTADGLRVDYAFAQPVDRVTLDLNEPNAPKGRVTAGDGFTLQDGVLSSAAPFRTASVLVAPDTERADASYPVLVNIGPGRVFYAPVLVKDASALRVRYRASAGMTLLGSQSGDGFLFIGPASQITRTPKATFIAPPDAPPAIANWVKDQTQRLIAYYAQKLGRSPEEAPIVMLDYRAAPAPDFAGDVTPHGMVLLQLAAPNAEAAAASEPDAFHLIAHEFFHLWNLHGDDADVGGNAHWIHEGSAEYAASLATHALHPELDHLDTVLSQGLGPCKSALGATSLVGESGVAAENTRYSCGMMAWWLLDLELRHQAPPHDVFAVWRELFGAGHLGHYDLAAMRAVTAALPSDSPYKLLVETSGSDRWAQIFAKASSYGVTIDDNAITPESYRNAALFTLMLAECGQGRMGFSGVRDIVLDDQPRCGELAGAPHLLAIADMRADEAHWADIYRAVASTCAAHQAIRVHIARADGEHDVQVTCTITPNQPRAHTVIANALPD